MRSTGVFMPIVTGLVILLGATAHVALAQGLTDREARLRALVPYERMVVISPGTTRADYDEVMRDLAREQVAREVEREAARNQRRPASETRRQPERRPQTPFVVPSPQSPIPRTDRRPEEEARHREERRDDDGRRDRDERHDRNDHHRSKPDEPAAVYTPASYMPPTYTPATYTPPSYTPATYTPPVYTPPTYGSAPAPQTKPDHERGRDDRDEGRQRYVDARTGRVCVVDRGVLFCS